MSTATKNDTSAPGTHELEGLAKDWWWFLLLGVVMVAFGIVSMSSAIYMFYTGIAMVILFGVMLLVGGVAQLVSSFWAGQWKGFLVHVLMGILYLVIGFIILDNPGETMLTLSLMLGAFFVVGGIFRIFSALQIRFHNWAWPLLNGFVTLLLGILILKQWPTSGLWVIGLFVGIELLFNGLSWVMLSFDVRRAARQEAPA